MNRRELFTIIFKDNLTCYTKSGKTVIKRIKEKDRSKFDKKRYEVLIYKREITNGIPIFNLSSQSMTYTKKEAFSLLKNIVSVEKK